MPNTTSQSISPLEEGIYGDGIMHPRARIVHERLRCCQFIRSLLYTCWEKMQSRRTLVIDSCDS